LDISAVVIIEVLPRNEGPHLPKFGHIFLAREGEKAPPNPNARLLTNIPYDGLEGGIIYPTDHETVRATRKVIIRGKPVSKPVEEPELLGLSRGESYVAIWGEVQYRDIFKVVHWTKFCRTEGPVNTPKFRSCADYDSVDSNDAPEDSQSQQKAN
jgi:hypothetical protein